MVHLRMLATEYRTRAAAEVLAGEASALSRVRDKHERAAQVWTQLAEAADAREAEQASRRADAENRSALS